MDNLQVRRARPEDLEALIGELSQAEVLDDRMSRQHKHLGMLLTAWRGDRPLGVIYLWLEDAEEAELREHLPGVPILNHLKIHPNHRRRGIGTLLIRAAERRLRMLGFSQVALAVETTNRSAARLYRQLGYADWPHPPVRCYSLASGTGERRVEICRILVHTLARDV